MEFFNKSDKGVNLEVNDEIGFWGVSHQDVKAQLEASSGSDIQLNISSLGGDVNHAFAIYNMLKSHKGHVVANVYGDAASAATLIALGADEVRMADNVFFMIHNVWTMAVGDAGELRKTADLMDKFNSQIVDTYRKKTGLGKAEIKQLMNDETWFTASEAKAKGFIDKITDASEILNRVEAKIFNSLDKETAKKLLNKININQKQDSEMEMNEEKVADSVFAKIKNYFQEEKKEVVAEVVAEPVIENKVSQEELIKNAVALAMEAATKENEALKAQLVEKEAKIENSVKDVEKANEEVAKAKASKTVVENKVDTEAPVVTDELEYASIIKNIVKKVKQIN
jgi:ATP-dependent protease ClpP protease subunit